jgi:hypothetical protein
MAGWNGMKDKKSHLIRTVCEGQQSRFTGMCQYYEPDNQGRCRLLIEQNMRVFLKECRYAHQHIRIAEQTCAASLQATYNDRLPLTDTEDLNTLLTDVLTLRLKGEPNLSVWCKLVDSAVMNAMRAYLHKVGVLRDKRCGTCRHLLIHASLCVRHQMIKRFPQTNPACPDYQAHNPPLPKQQTATCLTCQYLASETTVCSQKLAVRRMSDRQICQDYSPARVSVFSLDDPGYAWGDAESRPPDHLFEEVGNSLASRVETPETIAIQREIMTLLHEETLKKEPGSKARDVWERLCDVFVNLLVFAPENRTESGDLINALARDYRVTPEQIRRDMKTIRTFLQKKLSLDM